MEINKNAPLDYYTRVQTEQLEQTSKPDSQAKAQAALAPKSDTVSLSDEAQLRTEAYRTAMNTPELRAEKVAALKAQVADGSYQIDSLKIAQGIVRDESLF